MSCHAISNAGTRHFIWLLDCQPQFLYKICDPQGEMVNLEYLDFWLLAPSFDGACPCLICPLKHDFLHLNAWRLFQNSAALRHWATFQLTLARSGACSIRSIAQCGPYPLPCGLPGDEGLLLSVMRCRGWPFPSLHWSRGLSSPLTFMQLEIHAFKRLQHLYHPAAIVWNRGGSVGSATWTCRRHLSNHRTWVVQHVVHDWTHLNTGILQHRQSPLPP